MNTEINLLEYEPKKYMKPLLFGLIFIVLLMMAVTILLVQKNHYHSLLEFEQNTLGQMEAELLDHQQVIVSEQRRKQLHDMIQSIQDQRLPVVTLQEDIMSMLPSQSKMVTYQFHGGDRLELEADFLSLDDASQFVALLNEKSYTVDVDLVYVNQIESNYQANFIVQLNTENLIEELDKLD